MTLTLRPLPPPQWTPCLQWALPHFGSARGGWIVELLSETVQSGKMENVDAAAVFEADESGDGERHLAAAVCLRRPADAALLLLFLAKQAKPNQAEIIFSAGDREPSTLTTQSRQSSAEAVLQWLRHRLSQKQVTFLQAYSDDDAQAELLASVGFTRLADLSLMVLPSDRFAAAAEARDGHPPLDDDFEWVRLEDLAEDGPEIFSQVVARSFEQTRDCPALSEFRTPEEIAAGYLAAPSFTPSLCRLLRIAERWAGCLLLTRHESGKDVSLELTYMGLVPEYRGGGRSGLLVDETLRIARELDASRIILAVDQKNAPAVACYRRRGWSEAACESVWGMRISP